MGVLFSQLRTSSKFCDDSSGLIPYLPNEVSLLILARIPRDSYFDLKLVSKNWKATIMSHEILNLRKKLGKTEHWLYILTKGEREELSWHALDPLSRKWQKVPPLPNDVFEETSSILNITSQGKTITEFFKRWIWKTDPTDVLPCHGYGLGAVNGCIYILGGFYKSSTLSCVWRFDPILNTWSKVKPMSTSRACCKTGVLHNKLYVVGGVSRGLGGNFPLLSAEVYDPCTDAWSWVSAMSFSKTKSFAGYSLIKPIATDMISYLGQLFVPQSAYTKATLSIDVGGEVYNPDTNSWTEMPPGLGQKVRNVNVIVDNKLYAFVLSSSLDTGKFEVYDKKTDAWKVAISNVPVNDFSDKELPCFLAGFGAKMYMVAKDVNGWISILQADLCDGDEMLTELDSVAWDVATKNFGSSRVLSCQVVEV